MASPLQAVTLAAPGFYGLNTQESGITISSGFALEATNCVIDKFGRIGSRKGWTKFSNASESVTGAVRAIAEHTRTDGTVEIVFAANNKLFRLAANGDVTELTADDTTAITITDDDWQIASFNNHTVFVQDNHVPVYYDASAATYKEYSDVAFVNPVCVSACFNRMWVAENYTVYWSKILEPQSFTGTGTGRLDMREVFGEDDRVVAITSYNNRLVIFGRRNIAFFVGAEDPTSTQFQMTDHIRGIGCIARDSVQNVGTDVVFLSAEGVRTVGRTIQEQSSPIGDVSKNVRDDIVLFTQSEAEYRIKGIYVPTEAFYLLTLPATGYTYCFDMRAQLQDGSRRATLWTQIQPSAFCVRNDNTLLLGQDAYIGKYDGYNDDGSSYRLQYFTNYFDFGNATVESILKKVRLAIIGGSEQVAALKWAFDYNVDYKSVTFQLSKGSLALYNEDEYGLNTTVAGNIVAEQSASTITVGGVHYDLDFSTVNTVTYPVEITVYLDDDGYYYAVQDAEETRTETTLYFGVDDFTAEYSEGIILDNISLNLGGFGAVLQIGIEADVSSNALSIQKIDIFAKNGKLIS